MAQLEMKVPSPGESISEVIIANWLVKTGDWVEKDQSIAEIDSDKATLELSAEAAGIITLKAEAGTTVAVGDIVCSIDTAASRPAGVVKETIKAEVAATPSVKAEEKKSTPQPATVDDTNERTNGFPSPSAAKLMSENGISAAQISGSGPGGRIIKGDVLSALAHGFESALPARPSGVRTERREKMTSLRKKISERLVSVKNTTAMLTTFNEVNMKPIMDIRAKYKDSFKEKYGVGIGFMSFFTKAICEALYHFPAVNARIENGEIVYHDYCDIGVAVSTPKGLMVPNLRNAESMSLAEIERSIGDLAKKAREGKISVDDLQGGTFTITNGGVFGSMMSTPIINPPQSAILVMHNIVERPVAENGQVVIRPVMYVALSYDHRIIDGRESVGFLVKVKEMLEHPDRMIFGGKTSEEVLLGL
ncbi:MAG: 2-oxoglutarate dehydrogenase complex dihydrolipoyllysine-residue succinyltransferase [Crocinitomicaceae bacterium]|nr:2-oxoglutarate dehydrogenase complex dihydrolipoyllysine-residue succinyltransferase [Crocinitomicaceae bacterium]